MKKTINKDTLRNIVRKCVNEALKYDKERKQYFPNYTGDKHSDAGKFADNYRDDFNYTRNDYKWSNQKNQDAFNRKQWDKDMEIDPTDPDRENEGGAEEYLNDHDPYTIIEKATEELTPKFEDLLRNFFDEAAEQYPLFKNTYYIDDLIRKMGDVLKYFEY